MLYHFLQDEAELNAFVDEVLPETTPDECFVLMLCVRKKYLSQEEKARLVLDEGDALRREVVHDKRKLAHQVKELCVPRGLYKDRNGTAVPEHALAVYLTANPRSYSRAAVEMIATLAERLRRGQPVRLDSLVKTQIHRCVSRKVYLDVDVDPASGDDLLATVAAVRTILGQTPLHVIRTRSGSHVLVQTKHMDPAVKKTFYKQLQDLSDSMEGMLEIRGDSMVPIPGTFQGGAVPRLLPD
jgi:hypothetical protein